MAILVFLLVVTATILILLGTLVLFLAALLALVALLLAVVGALLFFMGMVMLAGGAVLVIRRGLRRRQGLGGMRGRGHPAGVLPGVLWREPCISPIAPARHACLSSSTFGTGGCTALGCRRLRQSGAAPGTS